MRIYSVLCGLAVVGILACSSSSDNGTPPVNQPPTISFTFPALVVPKASTADLTVSVSDPDGDNLSVAWQITRGTLTPQNTKKTINRWSVPATAGVDTVRVQVSDGTATRSVTAQIKVGTLFTNQNAPGVFAKAGSPYIVDLPGADPRLLVAAGSVTSIEAGVELYMDTPGSYINVLGDLTAHGTPSMPVVIRPNNRLLSCAGTDRGWWDGIVAATDIGAASSVDFDYVEIWYAKAGVRVRDNSLALIRNCKIRCSGDAGALMEGSGSLRVFDSEVTDGLSDGIRLAAFVSLPDSVRIEGCKLNYNGSAGIRMDLHDNFETVPIQVEFNDIAFNKSHGISLANAVFPNIHYNSFRGNGDETVSNLFLQGGYPGGVAYPELDATCNFWGSATNDQAVVDAVIRDILDTSTVNTRVISSPWLNVSPLVTPPNCP